MRFSSSGKITLAEFKDPADYRTNITRAGKTDLIIINSADKITGFDPYPTKIEFILCLPTAVDDYWRSLPGRRRNNLKRKYHRAETRTAVEFKTDISLGDFLAWYAGYRREMKRKIFGRDVIDDPITYFNNHHNLLLANILGRSNGKIIGGAILTMTENQLRYKLAWYGQEAKKYDAGYYLVLIGIEWAIDHQLREFSFGRDTNLYGGHLSLGLHQFKTAFNPQPMIPENAIIKNAAINPNSDRNQGFIFYTLENKELKMQFSKA